MSLPPGVLAQQLVRTFPQFTLCDAVLSATLGSCLDPDSNPDLSDFVQWLQGNPGSATAAGDILNPPGVPQTSAAPLDAALVTALLPLLTSTSSWIIAEPAFDGVAWTVQQGVTPGAETPQAATGAWSLSTQAPVGGLMFSDIAWSGAAARSFTLSLINDQPRHLGVYARFSKNGSAVVPAHWTSLVPGGVSGGFESDTVKYLGVLAPNAAVAGIPVDGSAQTIAVALPDNADAVQLLFGGLGSTGFSAIPDAAGVLLTFVLDIFVPRVVQASGQGTSSLAVWYGALLADRELVGQVLAGGGFLIAAGESDAMFSALSGHLTGVILGESLRTLREAIAHEFGAPPGETYSWVDQFAPAAGWAAQVVQSFLTGGLNAQYWAASTPATLTLDLSASTTLELDLILQPDPVSGIWPYAATAYEVAIFYGRGFSQTLSGPMPVPQSSAPLTIRFGSVRNAGPIGLFAEVRNSSGAAVAQAAARVEPPAGTASRTVSARLAVTDVPVTVGPGTQYKRVGRLTYAGGAYAWDPHAARPTASGPGLTSDGIPALTALNSLTLQGAQLCLGYAWSASNQRTTVCGGVAPLQDACFIQNIGTAVPASQLKTIGCGLVVAPQLAYSPIDDQSAPGEDGYYVDTQGVGVFLRPVSFGPGTFDLQASTSVGQFPPQSGLIGVCLHPAGYAAAVNRDRNSLQIVALAAAAVADAEAPVALAHGGTGSRVGLLSGPTGVAVMPNGVFVVLEQGNARVQAFDVNGNSVAVFNGQPVFALRAVAQAAYSDIAVSAMGLIYVLGSQNGGMVVSDCFFDIYNPDGTMLSSTAGVNAGKIAVDASQTLYTLDFDTLTGPAGRTEPVLSVWRPEGM